MDRESYHSNPDYRRGYDDGRREGRKQVGDLIKLYHESIIKTINELNKVVKEKEVEI